MPVPFRQWTSSNLVEIIGYLSVALFHKDGDKFVRFWLMLKDGHLSSSCDSESLKNWSCPNLFLKATQRYLGRFLMSKSGVFHLHCV